MKNEKYLSSRFDGALYALPDRLRRVLLSLPERTKTAAEEIRLRAGKPLIITVGGAPMWVGEDNTAGYLPPIRPVFVSAEELHTVYINLCNQSVYSHTDEIKQGFIMMKTSHRAGLFGTYSENGMRDISSVNIRIAREFPGCADALLARFDGRGLLIAGPPGCGKTTVLRDMVRQLSTVKRRRVAVIDSRGEIAACEHGVPQNDVGDNTDVITGVSKAVGIEMAVRTMYPQIVAFDEIGSQGEVEQVIKGLNSGVTVITTAHIGDREDLLRRDVTKNLIDSGAVSNIALLRRPGGAVSIFPVSQLYEQCV